MQEGKAYAWYPGGRSPPVTLSRDDIEELHRVAQLLDKHFPGWKRRRATPLQPTKGSA